VRVYFWTFQFCSADLYVCSHINTTLFFITPVLQQGLKLESVSLIALLFLKIILTILDSLNYISFKISFSVSSKNVPGFIYLFIYLLLGTEPRPHMLGKCSTREL
jgi:hypothetical protein